MQAAVAEGRDGAALKRPAVLLPVLEIVAQPAGLLGDEDAQAAMPGLAAGPAEEHQQVRPAGEGAPELGALDNPRPICPARGAAVDRGHVRADVRLGDGDRDQQLAGGDPRQPAALLLLAAGAQQGADQDLGPRHQGAARGEGSRRHLLGADQHREVVGAAGERAAVPLGNGQAEQAQSRDDVGGDVAVLPVDLLCSRRDAPGGEFAKRRPQQAVLLTGSDVVAGAAGEQEVRDPVVGRVE